MAVAVVSGITTLEEADQATDGTLISGGTSPTAATNDFNPDGGMYTRSSSGFKFNLKHANTNGTGRYAGKRFTWAAANLTGKFVLFGLDLALKTETYYTLFQESEPASLALAEDNQIVHLGTAFSVTANGNIYGGRFFKNPFSNTVHHSCIIHA
jgi:hypothetical protein